LKVDKGGSTMVMDKEDYVKKMYEHLNLSGCYKKLNKNPVRKIMKYMSEAIKMSSLDDDIKKKLIPSCLLIPIIYVLLVVELDYLPNSEVFVFNRVYTP
jgi:hypothetical protein